MYFELINDFLSSTGLLKSFYNNIELTLPGGILALGLITGFKHSIEADHIAAISTIVTTDNRRKKFLHIPYIGLLWGLGHTIALLSIALIIMVFSIHIPSEMSNLFEFIVGVMLIYLAVTAIIGVKLNKFIKGIRHTNFHKHPHMHMKTKTIHTHLHNHNNNEHNHGHRSIIVGMIHGLAGSGALMILVLSTISSVEIGLLYIVVFGIGSILSMAAVSTIIGLPLIKFGKRHNRMNMTIKLTSSIVSVCIGVSIMVDIIMTSKLF